MTLSDLNKTKNSLFKKQFNLKVFRNVLALYCIKDWYKLQKNLFNQSLAHIIYETL